VAKVLINTPIFFAYFAVLQNFSMNDIRKSPLENLGYNFVAAEYLPKGKNEYYLRNQQNKNGIQYRNLTAYEIEVLEQNRNTSDNWNNILVSNLFTPELVQNCKFFGLVRIGQLQAVYMEFHDLRRPVGLYNSTIISSDLGNNVVIDNCNYMSHYIVGNEVMIVNVNEVSVTDYARFGNGILKQGEDEKNRIVLEVCNENGGRSIVPFDGMLPGDAWLWSRFRDDETLQQQFKAITEARFDNKRGYYGEIGDRTVIKNSRIIKDVWFGSDAYVKGANKLKNLTINSNAQAKSQVGEGCELVNGIIAEGCRIFYGVKAVRFVMASHSQLKYGARLINSYLGNNATISCCEVLNSLIFPAHEQHHNNSFLCAALVMGQSNVAAGATIGSNHNSRGADGELIAARGFWPGLCVSLKHNSKFASFTMLAKGDYPAELNIPFPFSLISNNVSNDQLVVLPGYWFMHNMYALARNAWKYNDRDKRTDKVQLIEYDFLAPDTVNEMVEALNWFKQMVGEAYIRANEQKLGADETFKLGEQLLEANNKLVNHLEVLAAGVENSKRKTVVKKVLPCYQLFKELIAYYAASQIVEYCAKQKIKSFEQLQKIIGSPGGTGNWVNVGGQLLPQEALDKLLAQIRSGKQKSWVGVHDFYRKQGEQYPLRKLKHSVAIAKSILHISPGKKPAQLKQLLLQSITTREWMVQGIYSSRAKDYSNSFRTMPYSNKAEMNQVLGRLENNDFIVQEQEALQQYRNEVSKLVKTFRL
jgi:hypothetical protein